MFAICVYSSSSSSTSPFRFTSKKKISLTVVVLDLPPPLLCPCSPPRPSSVPAPVTRRLLTLLNVIQTSSSPDFFPWQLPAQGCRTPSTTTTRGERPFLHGPENSTLLTAKVPSGIRSVALPAAEPHAARQATKKAFTYTRYQTPSGFFWNKIFLLIFRKISSFQIKVRETISTVHAMEFEMELKGLWNIKKQGAYIFVVNVARFCSILSYIIGAVWLGCFWLVSDTSVN